jgi:MinD-like ATPase involved in chromosome partitioning or flagellar assembly
MRGIRIPQDLDGEDQFVLGLSVTRLSTLLFGLLAAYAILHLAIPGLVRGILAALVASVGAALTWLRPEGRSLGHWALAAIEFHLARSTEAQARPSPSRALVDAPRFSVVAPTPETTGSGAALDTDEDDVIELPGPAISAGHDVEAQDNFDDDAVPVYLGGTQIITFFSAKGGTGRTTLATEVSTLLARKGRYRPSAAEPAQPLRVVLVDFDLSSANVSARLGLAQPTMLDYVSDLAGIGADPDPRDYILHHQASSLDVLLGPSKCLAGDRSRLIGIPQAAHILSALRGAGYHFVIIDMGASVGDLETYLLEAAHRIYCVVTPTAGSVQSLYRGVEVLRRLGLGEKLRYVANKMRDGYNLEEPLGDLGGSLAARIPFDQVFETAENRHQPVVLWSEGTTRDAIIKLGASIYPALERPRPERVAGNPFSWLTRRRRAS